MLGSVSPRIVVDTNVVFEGLTKQSGASGLIIDAWLVGLMVSSFRLFRFAIRRLAVPNLALSL